MEKRKNKAGFTLLELLIVIAIMGMMGAIGFVGFAGMGRQVKIEGAAKTIRDKLVLARTNAITKARKFSIRMVLTPNTKRWKIITIDSVDNIFGNDNDRVIDVKTTLLDKKIELEEEQEIEFTPEGGISYATLNPIFITDNSILNDIWQIKLTLYKAAGMARVSEIIKPRIEDAAGTTTEEVKEEPESEADVLNAITG